MGFSSRLYPGETIIHETSPRSLYEPPDGYGAGLDLGLKGPFTYAATADPFPDELLVPESEWQARIQEMEELKTRLSDLSLQAELPCKNQQSTNYCWINAPTHCVEVARLVQNQPMVILSPASAGAPMTNFRNVGGWGGPGLEYIGQKGLVPVDKWPANAIDRKYWTEENKQVALQYRQSEWWELKPRNKAQLMSVLFRREVTAVGYNWWGHEVTAVEPVWLDGTAALRIRNSWGMEWGSKGFSILQGSKMLPDDAVAVRLVLASGTAPGGAEGGRSARSPGGRPSRRRVA